MVALRRDLRAGKCCKRSWGGGGCWLQSNGPPLGREGGREIRRGWMVLARFLRISPLARAFQWLVALFGTLPKAGALFCAGWARCEWAWATFSLPATPPSPFCVCRRDLQSCLRLEWGNEKNHTFLPVFCGGGGSVLVGPGVKKGKVGCGTLLLDLGPAKLFRNVWNTLQGERGGRGTRVRLACANVLFVHRHEPALWSGVKQESPRGWAWGGWGSRDLLLFLPSQVSRQQKRWLPWRHAC